jgi:S-adenosylmethionine synthetase
MALLVRPLAPRDTFFEVVERKGRGHPDSLSDAIAEALSLAYSRYTHERFGRVLHHNVDKVLLSAGVSQPRFGGGRVTTPITVVLGGRAVNACEGATIPVAALAEDTARTVLREALHALEIDRHVRVQTLIHPGSADLVGLFQDAGAVSLANDTSIGVGYAPLDALESAVLAIEGRLTDPSVARGDPAIGEDVKVMGIRREGRVDLTIACAMVDRHLPDAPAYEAAKRRVAETAAREAKRHLDGVIDVAVNAADDARSGRLFLTVTGTSAEAGDDGEAGRGNRANGLITPGRPMTMESLAGKNPISHAGKLYNLMAGLIAQAAVRDVPGVAAAECTMVSRIGAPIDRPASIDLAIATQGDCALHDIEPALGEIVARHLAWLPGLWHDLLARSVRFDRWPFAGPARPAFRDTEAERSAREGMVRVIAAEARASSSFTQRPSLGARVMATMARVPRHLFVPQSEERYAYADGPLPIGYGQTISQPFIVALMTDLARPREDHTVLEVGTGSGYQAAVLAELVRQVYSVETVAPLADQARRRLAQAGYVNVEVAAGDGALGWPEHAPFDAILLTAAAPDVPKALIDQLKPGGRLIAPVGNGMGQELIVIEKSASGALKRRSILPVAFVPLTGAHGAQRVPAR